MNYHPPHLDVRASWCKRLKKDISLYLHIQRSWPTLMLPPFVGEEPLNSSVDHLRLTWWICMYGSPFHAVIASQILFSRITQRRERTQVLFISRLLVFTPLLISSLTLLNVFWYLRLYFCLQRFLRSYFCDLCVLKDQDIWNRVQQRKRLTANIVQIFLFLI